MAAAVMPAEAEDALNRVAGQTAEGPVSEDDSDVEILSQPVKKRQPSKLDAKVGSRAAVADDAPGARKNGKDKGKGRAVLAQHIIELDDTDDEAASRPGPSSAAPVIPAKITSPTPSTSTRTDHALTGLDDGLEIDADTDAAYARQLFEAINGYAYADGPLLDGAVFHGAVLNIAALPSASASTSSSALRPLPTFPDGHAAPAFALGDVAGPSSVPLPGAYPQQVSEPVEDDATLAARFAAEEEAEWENEKVRRAAQEKADELYARVTQQNEELAAKRVRQKDAKKAQRKKQRLSGTGPSTGSGVRADSNDSEEESKIAFQVTMDADGKTIEGDEDADNMAHLELVKNDFQRAGAGGMGMGAGKGKGKGKGQGKGMGGLRIKKVTYFVNFELNRRFEAAKIALAQQGRDDTEQTLFHGTPEVNVQPILEDGFRVGGVDGARIVNGKAYGLGVYLARDPFLSMGYCKGSHKMFACRVVTGLTTPHAQQIVPLLPGQNAFDAYENQQLGIVVARHAHQVLPKYLVEFESNVPQLALPANIPIGTAGLPPALANHLSAIPGFIGATMSAQVVAGASGGGGVGAVSLPGGWSPYANQAPAKKRKRR